MLSPSVFLSHLLCSILLALSLSIWLAPGISLLSVSSPLLSPFIDNLLLIAGPGLFLIWVAELAMSLFLRRQKNQSRNAIAGIVGAMISFMLIALVYFSYSQYSDIGRPRKLLLVAWLMPLLIAYLLRSLKSVSAQQIWAVQGLLLILYIIILDSSYHFSQHKNPVAGLEQHGYHWKIQRSAYNNYKNSPAHYLDEIEQLRKYIPGNSRFFADKFTSYYVKSVLPIYAINAKSHHRNHRQYSLSDRVVRQLCQSDISDSEYHKIFRQIEKLDTQFAIINHDTTNNWLGTDCIYKSGVRLESYLERHYSLVTRGEVLSLYRL